MKSFFWTVGFVLTLAINLEAQDLQLDAFLEAPDPWYPGQVGSVIYKIRYKGSIQLLKEELPLLELPEFEKVGDKAFREYKEWGFDVQEIVQKFRAVSSGKFLIPASLIEGVAYKVARGKKQFFKPLLTSTVNPLFIEVVPFPTKGKPLHFYGSLGDFTFQMVPPKASSVLVGDSIPITIEIKGDQDMETLHFPRVECLPGIDGFFSVSSPLWEEGKVTFTLTPLNALAFEIPPIPWNQFDPSVGYYRLWESTAIPLVISDLTPTPSPLKIVPLGSVEPPVLDYIEGVPQPRQRSWVLAWLSHFFGVIFSLMVVGFFLGKMCMSSIWLKFQQWLKKPLVQFRYRLFYAKREDEKLKACLSLIEHVPSERGRVLKEALQKALWANDKTFSITEFIEKSKKFIRSLHFCSISYS